MGFTKLHFALGFIALLSLGICSCQKKQDKSNDLEIIKAAIQQFSTDLVTGDYAQLAAAYTEDAKLFPPGKNIIEGREAIQAYWTPQNPGNSKMIEHEIFPIEIRIVEDWAFDYGFYEGKNTKDDSIISPFRGKYQIIWKKENSGEWKIYTDIWSRAPLK